MKKLEFEGVYNAEGNFDFYETGAALPKSAYRARFFRVAAEIENKMTAAYGSRPARSCIGERALFVLNATGWRSMKSAIMLYTISFQ
jgi:hypothetical protein